MQSESSFVLESLWVKNEAAAYCMLLRLISTILDHKLASEQKNCGHMDDILKFALN